MTPEEQRDIARHIVNHLATRKKVEPFDIYFDEVCKDIFVHWARGNYLTIIEMYVMIDDHALMKKLESDL